MTLKQNLFDGGTTGSTVTTANSGGASGTAFNLAPIGANATCVYSTVAVMHGARSALCTISSAGTANNIQLLYSTPAGTSRVAVRGYFRFVSLPTATQMIMAVSESGTGNYCFRLYINPDGTVRVDDLSVLKFASTPALALNTWYRFEAVVTQGTTTSNGSINFAGYAGDATTAISGMTYTASTINAGTGATLSNVQWGKPTSGDTVASTFYLDSVAANDGATAFIGPYALPNVPPTANAGSDQANVEPWSTVTLTGTDSDSDGTVASRSWSQTGGSPTVTLAGSGASRTFQAPGTIAGTTLTFQYSATDNAGATTTDTMTVTVLPASERILLGGSWVPARIRLM